MHTQLMEALTFLDNFNLNQIIGKAMSMDNLAIDASYEAVPEVSSNEN